MKYKHIVWDWNGTIIDDVRLSVEIFNMMCGECGLGRTTVERYRREFKIPVVDFYRDYGFDFDRLDFRAISEFYIKEYNRRRFECPLHDGVREAMASFKGAGISQSVLSAYESSSLRSALEHFGLCGYLENICGLGDILAGSKTELAKDLAGRIRAAPDEILMIGDTLHDMDSANAMGADCVFISKGHTDAERLRGSGARVFASHGELSDFVLNS